MTYTVKELIAKLNELDPTGELEVTINDGQIEEDDTYEFFEDIKLVPHTSKYDDKKRILIEIDYGDDNL